MTTNINDPLGLALDLSTFDTSRPVLPEGLYVLRIENVEMKENKAGTGNNLVVTFATTVDTPDATGFRVIEAGYTVMKYYPLQQSDNPKAPDFRRDLAVLQDAVEGSTNGTRNPSFQPFNYVGREVVGRIKIRKDDEFGAQNDIGKLEYKG